MVGIDSVHPSTSCQQFVDAAPFYQLQKIESVLFQKTERVVWIQDLFNKELLFQIGMEGRAGELRN